MPQLAELQATDALLDRLAARTPTSDDLLDPIIRELARLAEFTDEAPVAPPGMDRLIEVLDGRPLYMFDRGSETLAEEDRPIQLDQGRPVTASTRVIDLSDSALDAAEPQVPGQDEDGELPGVAARTASAAGRDGAATEPELPAVASLALIRSMRAASARATASGRPGGWQGAIHQMALPAASVVILALLGGGVSAVVTGDPMSPVYGVTKVASQLTGQGGSQKVRAVRRDISQARTAIQDNPVMAKEFLKSAQGKVGGVPDESQPALQGEINSLQKQLSVATPVATPSVTSTPAPSVTPSASTPPVTPSDPPTSAPSVTDSPAETVPPPAGDPATAGAGNAAGHAAGNTAGQ